MTSIELRTALERRRQDLKLSYRVLQKRTGLGYNTVRRIFTDPFACGFKNVLIVCETLGCCLVFTVEHQIGDEIVSGTQPPLDEVVQGLKNDLMAE